MSEKYLISLIAFIVVLVLYVYYRNYVSLANRLNKSWYMVYKNSCPFCVKQKKMLGQKFKNYVIDKADAYPMWVHKSGKKIYGFKNRKELMEMSKLN